PAPWEFRQRVRRLPTDPAIAGVRPDGTSARAGRGPLGGRGVQPGLRYGVGFLGRVRRNSLASGEFWSHTERLGKVLDAGCAIAKLAAPGRVNLRHADRRGPVKPVGRCSLTFR